MMNILSARTIFVIGLSVGSYIVWDILRGVPRDVIMESLRKGGKVYFASHDSLTTGTRSLYENVATASLGTSTQYLNLGYWKHATNYDDACNEMADLLSQSAHVPELPVDGSSVSVLDVGSGFGDQSFHWARKHSGIQFVGLNIAPSQVEAMNVEAKRRGLHPRVSSVEGSATSFPKEITAQQFDAILALESAFHFDTRQAFFQQSFNALRPGGYLGLADIIAPTPVDITGPVSLLKWMWWQVSKLATAQMWFIHPDNWIDTETYKTQLAAAGFVDIQVQVISDDVFVPFGEHGVKRAKENDVVSVLNPFAWYVGCKYVFPTLAMEYVIVSGRKPSPEQS